MIDPPDTMKALTTIVIAKTLLDIGKPVYDKVTSKLYKKYHCYIPDCFEKPEYLKEILEELYGASHRVIVHSIEQQLSEFAYKNKTETFLTVLLK
ncbi:MAG TPA: hypothetical protein VEU72_01520 [Nitrosopumilaceae archaeon]|nr:hypothetical protein [Nitrosopumilaceae archaeon]